ncbi:hypothetical protein OMP43_03865 [Sphingomonas sp. CBMAI 2297]|uniref:hypothetical protein n=1 Tax=Sphingomonas sp. CBMAI 2297 TaxID=2991720 RepID=UPI002457A55E|nr:hypothetical protein [Sphingomonas sp. CBMAI 2297]MDH4743151.1 hypothetical protein [Sphingomonas sp. CBMAI 2297]
MEIKVNGYSADTRTVSVTYDHAGVTHTRDVNACHDEAGAYDQVATAARVEEVGAGVAAKIAAGAITNPPPAEEEEPGEESKGRKKKKTAPAE